MALPQQTWGRSTGCRYCLHSLYQYSSSTLECTSTSVLGQFSPSTDLHIQFGPWSFRSSVTSLLRTEVTQPDQSLHKSDWSVIFGSIRFWEQIPQFNAGTVNTSLSLASITTEHLRWILLLVSVVWRKCNFYPSVNLTVDYISVSLCVYVLAYRRLRLLCEGFF